LAIANNLFTLAPAACAILEALQERQVVDNSLIVVNPRPVRPRVGWLYMTVMLKDRRGLVSTSPIITGIVSGGGRGVKPWFECRLYPIVEFADHTLEARSVGVEGEAVHALSDLIPDGGHLMLDYENAGQEETFAELVLRVPPAASYLGSLMFAAGCRGEFKDWYFSEGGHEGPRKLQANKSPDKASAHRALTEHLRQFKAFIRRPLPSDHSQAKIIKTAQQRARRILDGLRSPRRAQARR
jgi:hypothetical protein